MKRKIDKKTNSFQLRRTFYSTKQLASGAGWKKNVTKITQVRNRTRLITWAVKSVMSPVQLIIRFISVLNTRKSFFRKWIKQIEFFWKLQKLSCRRICHEGNSSSLVVKSLSQTQFQRNSEFSRCWIPMREFYFKFSECSRSRRSTFPDDALGEMLNCKEKMIVRKARPALTQFFTLSVVFLLVESHFMWKDFPPHCISSTFFTHWNLSCAMLCLH